MHHLSKETLGAIRMFKSVWNSRGKVCIQSLHVEEEDITTGFVAFAKEKITLQKGNSWRWNRSIYVQDIKINPNITISFQKMNSRSKVAGVKVPTYKLWQYTITIKGETDPLYFIWCEKGNTNLRIQDFSFLKDFVTPELATELKWVDETPKDVLN